MAERRLRERPINWNKVPGSARMQSLVFDAVKEAEKARRQQSEEQGRRARSLRPVLRPGFEAAVSSLVCNAVSGFLLDDVSGVFLSLDIARLGRRDPLKPLAENSGLPKRVRELEAAGWLEVDWGRRSAAVGRRQTVIRAGFKLRGRIAEWRAEHGDVSEKQIISPVVMREQRGTAQSSLSPRALRVAAELSAINQKLVDADIRWSVPLANVDLAKRVLHRTFRDKECMLGGRMTGGFWFQMSKQSRFEHILLDGEPIVELDYSGMVLSIAYGLEAVSQASLDVYAVPGLESVPRDAVKILVNAMVWDERPRRRVPRGTASSFQSITGEIAAGLVVSHHAAIRSWLQAGRGLELQRYESDIISLATQRALSSGIPALPVHDALYVPTSRSSQASGIMEDAFREVCGGEVVIRMMKRVGEGVIERAVADSL